MFRRILVSSLLLALPAVAAADVRVDVDRHTDFAKYSTFSVEIGPLVRTDGVVAAQSPANCLDPRTAGGTASRGTRAKPRFAKNSSAVFVSR